MTDLLTVSELAKRTGYTRDYINKLVRTGKVVPAKTGQKGKGGPNRYKPDCLTPKPGYVPSESEVDEAQSAQETSYAQKVDKPVIKTLRICGFCQHYAGCWCDKHGRRTAYNRVACDNGYNENAEAVEAAKERAKEQARTEESKMSEPITSEQKEAIIKAYKETHNMLESARRTGVSKTTAWRVVHRAGLHRTSTETPAALDATPTPEGIVAENEREAAAVQQPAETLIGEPKSGQLEAQSQSDDWYGVATDFEEAQRALAMRSEIRRIYGDDAPELEQAAVQVYKRRKSAA